MERSIGYGQKEMEIETHSLCGQRPADMPVNMRC